MKRVRILTVSVATAIPASTTISLQGLAAPALVPITTFTDRAKVAEMRAFIQGSPAGAGLATVQVIELHPRLVWANALGVAVYSQVVESDFVSVAPAQSPTLPVNGDSIFACVLREHEFTAYDNVGAPASQVGIDLAGTATNTDAANPHNITVGVAAILEF